jgi:hypothetical protein
VTKSNKADPFEAESRTADELASGGHDSARRSGESSGMPFGVGRAPTGIKIANAWRRPLR